MKDSSVSPAGLFDTRRQRKLLDGLADRFRGCLDEQAKLREQHQHQQRVDEEEFSQRRAEQMASCRAQRREMLSNWDQAEEQLISHYESTTIRGRSELNRLVSLFRRKAAEERKAIELKVQSREQAILQQYESAKNQPVALKRKALKRIDEALLPLQNAIERARDLTLRRLDGLPDVPAEAEAEDLAEFTHPRSVDQAVEAIQALTKRCDGVLQAMNEGPAARVIDSYLLPGVGVGFAGLWALVAYFVAPDPPWLWMIAGIIPAGILVFVVLLVLMMPLKRQTAQLYPSVVRLGQQADRCAAEARKIAARNAVDAANELTQRRDSQIEAAHQWQTEQLAALTERMKREQEEARAKLQRSLINADEEYTREVMRVGTEMRTKADALAHQITDQLGATDRVIQQQREARSTIRASQLKHLSDRLKAGVSRGLHRMTTSVDEVRRRFPDWNTVLTNPSESEAQLDYLPVGFLQVGESLGRLLRTDLPGLLGSSEIPEQIPVVLHRRLHSGLVIESPPQYMDRAIDLAHQVMWRLLTAAPPSRAKLTLIDPLGRGQHFTNFMALADHDPALVGHRVWTTDAKIDARLGELAHHVEDVLQTTLRDRFERIEDYNELAGSMAEPYRGVAAVGFPEGLTRDGYRHLRALLESGLRCGIFTIIACDSSKPWPADMPLPDGEKVLRLGINEHGDWHVRVAGLEQFPFRALSSPTNSIRSELIDKIGKSAVAASRVEIPLDQILTEQRGGRGSTDDGIEILIGSQGANRALALRLGEGVRQHVLIAGKTGSGKSTLLHSIITSGAHHYTPDQLEFYLLDFKKGVEFKPYADSGLPHARVIGIESEREFGRSVLQRLDAELQTRGEKFRSAGAQELGDFRDTTGETLPRIVLVVDEFQELFVRDDRLAGDCTMLLDRLVRQGRSFGMHVILSSQSLAGAYSLPRATLGQMAVRIAMQCSESDAALILADDNTAARLISRPGEAIYNDAGGLIEGNQPFQVAWLSTHRHRQLLREITERDRRFAETLAPPVVFEGNRPCRWTPSVADAARSAATKGGLCGLLGESVEIGPPLSLELVRETGRNVLLMSSPETRTALLASAIAGFIKSDPRTELIYFDGTRVDDPQPLSPWLAQSGIAAKVVKVRDSEMEMARLGERVGNRSEEDHEAPPILVVIDPLERFRDLRQEESFSFSLDPAASGANAGVAFQNVLRDGPAVNVFVVVVCGSVETLSRWLPRASQRDLELRVLGQMNASDSALLIDSPVASDLSAATMLLYDDADGRITKFRQCDLPDPQAVRLWLS